ncbi:solute/sodium symporter (SSS) family protein [Myxococcus stipitatus DSM 14675]|uniref:Solute/sodium symporter (SSS) family protein n=1 Tax=Myxococcus stipitatus (strain DSM 14675 / JCM 12634 / Mx s8) TaxID=1278073 RepID=L7UGE5_MYXSD|nr:sodium:solute symporter [Myxococcus stipitatus]AGC48041.1 solute/sodium symporter (SSS) family protein [Myxococcus stipitatus DSM 14675]
MTSLDWLVLVGTISLIVGWGMWKARGARNAEDFLRGKRVLKWHTIGLTVMATQASAITFLSVPGQAYEDGMRFVQFYFGLPFAMILISAVFVPIYYKMNVITAYQYLESRFDLKTRLLGAFLFLVQRGMAAGITLYAPSIILSTILGWPLEPTVLAIGAVVILYTVSGGASAVSQTQKQQMVVMMGGMVVAALVILWRLPSNVGFGDAVDVAGAFGRLNVVSFDFNVQDRYNFWSGITGGFFLALSYFGTDQSQVGRYLSGNSISESRLGLLFNGVLKLPMQFIILFVGILVFVFYQFNSPPLLFNDTLRARVQATEKAGEYAALESKWEQVQSSKREQLERYLAAGDAGDAAAQAGVRESLRATANEASAIRKDAKTLVTKALPGAETKDSDYIFIGFVKRWLPSGLFGLLIAVILSAAMSSIASELTALGATTTVDFYRRLVRPEASDKHVLVASKAFTVFWGMVAVSFASFASLLDNLIQAVNILGSIFYGTVLGLFLVAFFLKHVKGHAVFTAAVISQTTVIALFMLSSIGYLWYNVIGCALVVVLSLVAQAVMPRAVDVAPVAGA